MADEGQNRDVRKLARKNVLRTSASEHLKEGVELQIVFKCLI